MTFSPQRLVESLLSLPRVERYWIAYSGGMDSTVLLHALASLKKEIQSDLLVIHVDHGLTPHSVDWSNTCKRICGKLDLPFELLCVDARGQKGESPEAAARRARYDVITPLIAEDEMLLTAHHQDDQAETLLLQLLRGAGPHGLAAMPSYRSFSKGWLGRPLLGFNRSELLEYARAEGLEWIDDPSNFDTGFERNFLRHQLLPLLKERRGEIATVLARSASHFAEAATLLDALAEKDLAELSYENEQYLPVDQLLVMDLPRLRNLLRYWIRLRGLPLPDSKRLERVINEVLKAADDAQPLVEWTGAEARRYQDRFFVISPLQPEPDIKDLEWFENNDLALPNSLGRLAIIKQDGQGISVEQWSSAKVTVRFRRGGERCVPDGRGQHHALKKLFQEEGVPPWWRSRWPLIFLDDHLAAVPGLFICEPYKAEPNEPGITIDWQGEGSGIANRLKKKQNR